MVELDEEVVGQEPIRVLVTAQTVWPRVEDLTL